MSKLSVGILAALSVSLPLVSATAANDPDSIGKTVKYLDYAAGKPMMMAITTTGAPPCDTNVYRCFTLTTLGAGTFDVPDLTTVEIAANASRSLICSSIQYNATYIFKNFATDSSIRRAAFMARSTFKIESAALNDLNLINPLTGVPFNGAIVRQMPMFLDEANLATGQFEQHSQNWSSECTKGFLSRSMLMKDFGLSATVAQRVITQPIKVTIGANVTNNFLNWSTFNIAIRMYSD